MGILVSIKDFFANQLWDTEPDLAIKLEQRWKELSKKDNEAIKHLERIIQAATTVKPLEVGNKIPNFRLPNIREEGVRAKNLLRKGPLVISFYRGNWCPFCQLELKELQNFLPEIESLGVTLIGISPQTTEQLKETATNCQLSFELLSDTYNELAREFGLAFPIPKGLHTIYEAFGIPKPKYNTESLYELPIPATFLVGQDGKIAYRFMSPDYTKRLDPKNLIEAIKNLERMR